MLTREQILAAQDLPSEVVPVPEWGGDVRIRTLTTRERDRFEAATISVVDGKPQLNTENVRARLVALCAVDDTGARLFSDEDTDALGAKNASAVERLFSVAQRLNGFSKDDIEQLSKN